MRVTVLIDESVDVDQLTLRDAHWSEWFDAHVIDALKVRRHAVTVVQYNGDVPDVLEQIFRSTPDVVFNLALGAGGDRGKEAYIAAALELAGLAYTGASPRGLMLAGDKGLSKQLLRHSGIEVPDFQIVHTVEQAREPEKFPILVKALNRGGSEGLTSSSLVRNFREMCIQVHKVVEEYACPVICEEYITGREISVGVVGDKQPRVLPAGEWHFGRGPQFVTQKLKWDLPYSDKCGVSFKAAELDRGLRRRIVQVCQQTYRLLELRDYGSIDMRIRPDGRIVVLEANANTGLFPDSFRFKAIPFPSLIQSIVKAAARRSVET